MGLTNRSVGRHAAETELIIRKNSPDDAVIALAGNPNVGKSTVFNGLTGMHQHTGNWPGKTVANVQGICKTEKRRHILVDIPGTYSLSAHSAEEAVARDFICFGNPDAVVVVCDATCLERNLNLVLQITEVSSRVVVCVNLMDEAKRHHIEIDIRKLSKLLGLPVVGITARNKGDLARLSHTVDSILESKSKTFRIPYPPAIEHCIKMLLPALKPYAEHHQSRWLAVKLLEQDPQILSQLHLLCGEALSSDTTLQSKLHEAWEYLAENTIKKEHLTDLLVSTVVNRAEIIAKEVVKYPESCTQAHRLDRFLTGRISGYVVMLVLLIGIFWLTITGTNYPSAALSSLLFRGQELLSELFQTIHAPNWLHDILVLGVYRVLAWVVSVMLPPMAIFFPLFTLLEDAGYLPRIAYNLDKPFARCHACGKQALTMCMGFGCNAAGVVGCRIIDSPRERLLAILTNSFVPCNGRFPTLIAIISMFFITADGLLPSIGSSLILTLIILLGIAATFGITGLLSETILKGAPSAFTLELPPFRRPQIGKVIWRSLWERTVFVLGRAAAVAAPAGLLIWLAANVHIGDVSILQHSADFLDPFARLLGLDGVILIAFVLGFPANEIVLPIILMAYTTCGTLTDIQDLSTLRQVLISNGWSPCTAVCTILFSLFHWPCSTTLITIKKETGSIKWTLLAAVLPTVIGMLLCASVATVYRLFMGGY